jgi:apolipoprotein N-acyltransferase
MWGLFDRLARLRGARADLVAAALGALAALALPPVHALPVLWLSVPGLLVLIDGSPRPAVAFRRGFWFGFAHNLLGLYWITEAILVESERLWWLVPLAVPALSALMAVFIGLACALARPAHPGLPRVLALAGAWVLTDMLRMFVLGGFPWNLWGGNWTIPGHAGDVFIQPAAWLGVYGLTLLTVLVAAGPLFGRPGWTASLLGLLIWIAAGQARMALPAGPAPRVAVVLVQGDVPEGHKFDRAFMDATFQRHLALTAQGVAELGGRPGTVVWPEAASPFLLMQDPEARAAIAKAAGGGTAGFRPALIGTVRFDQEGYPKNSLVALDGDGTPLADYDKWHLVPFGEYAPSWLPLPIQVVPGRGFGAGDGPETMRLTGLPPVAPFICYEAIYSAQVVDESDRPDWMVNVTNDAWFGNSSGPRQHLAAARMRAVEEGLPLMRAANTGITAGFDAHGHELGRLPMSQPGVLVLDLPGRLPTTIYARFGLAIPLLLAILSLWSGYRPFWRK